MYLENQKCQEEMSVYEPRTAIKSQALADFVADFTSDLQDEVYLEVHQLGELNEQWILHTDNPD